MREPVLSHPGELLEYNPPKLEHIFLLDDTSVLLWSQGTGGYVPDPIDGGND